MPTDADLTEKTDVQALLRLMTWLSPSFPTGAFTYSHGLEHAVEAGLVTNDEDLRRWISDLLFFGSGWNDSLLLSEAWRRARSGDCLKHVNSLCEALAGSMERHLETTAQGAAFLSAARQWPHPDLDRMPDSCALPVAVGAVAGSHDVCLQAALAGYLHAFCNNLVQASLRLLPVGQQAGVGVMASLEKDILAASAKAAAATLDDLGSSTIISEIMSLKHETQSTRIFRS